MVNLNCAKNFIGDSGVVILHNESKDFFVDTKPLYINIEANICIEGIDSEFLNELEHVLRMENLEDDSIILTGFTIWSNDYHYQENKVIKNLSLIKELSNKYNKIICVKLASQFESRLIQTIDTKHPRLIDLFIREFYSFECPAYTDDGRLFGKDESITVY